MTAAALETAPAGLDKLTAFKVLLFVPDLRDADRRVGGALVEHANGKTGRCDPSMERLARQLGMSVRSVSRAVEALVKARLVVRRRHAGRCGTHAYAINWQRLRSLAAAVEEAFRRGIPVASLFSAPSSDQPSLSTTAGQECPAGPDTGVYQTQEETQEENPRRGSAPPSARSPVARLKAVGKGHSEARQAAPPATPPDPQHSFMLPIPGGKTLGAAAVSRTKAHQRMYEGLRGAVGSTVDLARVLAEMTPEIEDYGLKAEMTRAGTGARTVLQALHDQVKGGRHDAQAAA